MRLNLCWLTVLFVLLVHSSAWSSTWMGGFGVGARSVHDLAYDDQVSMVHPLSLSAAFQTKKIRIESELAYYSIETSESIFTIERDHYEFNLLAHYSLKGHFEGWAPRLFLGPTFFQETIETQIGPAYEKNTGEIESGLIVGGGFEGPLGDYLSAYAEARAMFSDAQSEDVSLELNLGLLLIF